MIREKVVEKLRDVLNVEEIPLNIPPKPEMGDFSSAICLALAKQRRQSPMNIAKEASAALKAMGLPDFLEEVNVSPPGYLNFKVNWPKLASVPHSGDPQ